MNENHSRSGSANTRALNFTESDVMADLADGSLKGKRIDPQCRITRQALEEFSRANSVNNMKSSRRLVYFLCIAISSAFLQSITRNVFAADPDPGEVLKEAKALRAKGEFAAALDKHVWFHDNSLKLDRSYYGVRLSFALSDWVELGNQYPPAKKKLMEIRNAKAERLRKKQGDFALFHDVASINRHLNLVNDTCALFKQLHKEQASLAKECYSVSSGALVSCGEYELCLLYVGDPQKAFGEIHEAFESRSKLAKKEWGEEYLEVQRNKFDSSTRQLIEILVNCGAKAEAEKVRDRALKVRDTESIRSSVSDAEGRLKN